MKLSPLRPRVHLYVCTNRRAPDDPLGGGCSDRGDQVYAALKREVARRGLHRDVWVARTHCLGVCPRVGCTVGLAPATRYLEEVTEGDAAAVIDTVLPPPR